MDEEIAIRKKLRRFLIGSKAKAKMKNALNRLS